MNNGHVQLDDPVLILNINYEPLHVCNIKRALGLIFAGKAEIVLNGRGVIKTSQSVYDLPSIIKLAYMVRRPRPHVNLNKREILRRDNYTCQYCGRRSTTLTIDHIVPRSAGGGHTWTNLVAACPSCNRRKGGRTPAQADMRLHRVPKEPPATALYRFGRFLRSQSEWEPFIRGW